MCKVTAFVGFRQKGNSTREYILDRGGPRNKEWFSHNSSYLQLHTSELQCGRGDSLCLVRHFQDVHLGPIITNTLLSTR
ncbi:hypothetical protein Q8A67_022720 [Cirrhinus molitorella]|uniref:Uncharacterized protein n=1 Tax=Cirrhinus molitorella TaxID=172907 RepID=A0AA88TDP3_9TELE|nr:hypothetical protein Q8A67_022720 [Cirrhinus molitorella]